MFKDRIDAAYKLAAKLEKYKNGDCVMLAIPKGAVPMGYIIAKELSLPLDLALTKKIGHPSNKEYAIGAVSLLGSYIVHHEKIPRAYIDNETTRIREYLKSMQDKYLAGRSPLELKDKIVILVDDGIATGNTLLAIINILKKQRVSKIVIAVPVASGTAYNKLSSQVDELIALDVPEFFTGVGAFYEEFEDVSEQEVKYYLDKAYEEYSRRTAA